MSRLVWDEQNYSFGLDRGVFYPKNSPGVPWNGLISVEEKVELLQDVVVYRDGVKVARAKRPDTYSATVEAFTYPAEFYDGLFSSRRTGEFGFSYRTNTALGQRIHLVYNVFAQMTERAYEQEDPTPFQWDFSTRSTAVPEATPTAHLIIDTSNTYPETLATIEARLYGDDENTAHLPTPFEIFDLYEVNAVLKVVDHGDGTFTITGPDSAIEMVGPTEYRVTWPSGVYIDEDTYTIRSL